MYMPARRCMLTQEASHFRQPAAIRQRMHRIETQTVEAILTQPIQGVFREESPDFRLAEIDCRSPRRVHVSTKKIWSVRIQVVSVRPEMVINHVEEHHDAHAVGR